MAGNRKSGPHPAAARPPHILTSDAIPVLLRGSGLGAGLGSGLGAGPWPRVHISSSSSSVGIMGPVLREPGVEATAGPGGRGSRLLQGVCEVEVAAIVAPDSDEDPKEQQQRQRQTGSQAGSGVSARGRHGRGRRDHWVRVGSRFWGANGESWTGAQPGVMGQPRPLPRRPRPQDSDFPARLA